MANPDKDKQSSGKHHAWQIQQLMDAFPWVKSIVDATYEVALVVSAADIETAIPGDPMRCALRNAAVRAGYQGAFICRKMSYLIQGDQAIRFQTPGSTWNNIKIFDLSGAADPGTLMLKPPSPSEKLGKAHRRAKISQTITKRGRKRLRSRKAADRRQQIAARKGIAFRSWGGTRGSFTGAPSETAVVSSAQLAKAATKIAKLLP